MQASEANEDPKVQFNVYLPRSVVTALKHRAIDEGLSMSAFIERVARDYLKEQR